MQTYKLVVLVIFDISPLLINSLCVKYSVNLYILFTFNKF